MSWAAVLAGWFLAGFAAAIGFVVGAFAAGWGALKFLDVLDRWVHGGPGPKI